MLIKNKGKRSLFLIKEDDIFYIVQKSKDRGTYSFFTEENLLIMFENSIKEMLSLSKTERIFLDKVLESEEFKYVRYLV